MTWGASPSTSSLGGRTWPCTLLAVAAYLFLAPNVDFAANLQWHDGQRLAQLVLLAVTLCALAAPGALRELLEIWVLLPCWCRIALLTAFALGLVSSVIAPLPRWALLDWGMLWLLLVLALAIASQRRHAGGQVERWLVLVFFATATAYAISSSVVYLAMLQVGPFFNVRELYVGFSNVRFFGPVQTMVLPFLLLPAMWWGTTFARCVLLSLVPAFWWMLVAASGTRGTWVALLIGVAVAALFGGTAGRKWIKWQFGGLLCGLVCYAVFIWAVPQLFEQATWFIDRTGDIGSLSSRDALWTRSTAFMLEHPLLGIGPMHYAYLESAVAAHPHSAVLQWFAEWGIPATLLLTGVCAYAGLMFALHVRGANKGDQGAADAGLVSVALLAALAGVAAQAMVDGVLVMPVSQTLLSLLGGWAIGSYYSGQQHVLPSGSQRYPVFNRIIITLTVTAAVAVASGVLPEINRIADREQAYLQAHPVTDPSLPRLFPRFWTQGWIRE